jgi:AbiV
MSTRRSRAPRIASATAAGLLKDADILAGAGSYGTATSPTTLGFEESVKARTLAAIAAIASAGHRPGFREDADAGHGLPRRARTEGDLPDSFQYGNSSHPPRRMRAVQ